MSHLFRWIAFALALAPATPFAEPQRPAGAAPVPVVAVPGPVIPQPGQSVAPTGAPATTAGDQTPPGLAGRWQAIEVLIFERPGVGLSPQGELLLTDAPRRLPSDITGFDPVGVGGTVRYPLEPTIGACLWAPADAPPGDRSSDGPGPAAFRAPATQPDQPDPPEASTATPAVASSTEASAPTETPAPDPLLELQRALADYENALTEQSLTWLPASANGLAASARRLTEQGGYTVLLHRTWIQNLAGRTPVPRIFVQSPPAIAGTPVLEGTLQLRRNLEFTTELWYQAPSNDPTGRGRLAPTSSLPGAAANTHVAGQEPVQAAQSADLGYIRLAESHRLTAGKVHYIDHPKLGIIVRTTPVGLPAAILEAWTALNPPVAETPAATDRPTASPLP